MIKRLTLGLALMIGAIVSTGSQAEAQGPAPFGFGFQPFGFYQPYGATYGTSLRTPPYFALNPPVYYGARYSRPYGISPFATPPMVNATPEYRPRLRTPFIRVNPGSSSMMRGAMRPPASNPFIHVSRVRPRAAAVTKKGDVQLNPYVKGQTLASK